MVHTDSPSQPAEPIQSAVPPQRKNRRGKVLAATAALIAFGLGAATGAAASSNTAALTTAQHRVTVLHSQVSALQGQLTTAQRNAAQADASAEAKAKASYATRSAALDSKAASLAQRERAVSAAEGRLQSSQISDAGVYVVGGDIKPGTYHTSGDGGQGGNACYYALLSSTNTGDIIDNNNFDGPETVNVSGAAALEIDGPCSWIRVS